MKTIGGFFELELPLKGRSPHPEAIALSTGRACLMVILDVIRPSMVHVPFHTCDATLEPFKQLKIETRFYALKENLEPASLPILGIGEYFLWTNYYGLCGDLTDRLKQHYADRLIIDDTHAFFQGIHPGHWSFTSARKYFGVPDGAYLFTPRPIEVEAPRFTAISMDHGMLRAMGLQQEAFAAYQRYEACLPCAVNRISTVSEGLLRGVDLEATKARRRLNFEFFAERIGHLDHLKLHLASDAVPFCFPFLPESPMDRAALYTKGFFIPRYWPDAERRNTTGFEVERRLGADLLPLPVDHRYTPEDLMPLVHHILQQQ
ncbi:MAG: hypothetical protein IPP83_02710 [Flavobacteriales bacterium]|nr:hypothetical protein [Flavobacteriales bacterium]